MAPATLEVGRTATAVDIDALALHLLHGTQQAALACRGWIGRGDAKGADQAAVAAMRAAFDLLPGAGTVVIGEGEKDAAPMLFIGEHVGDGVGAAFDLAVDPLENTKACARDLDGAMAVVAAAPRGSLWGSPAAWYMDKLVVGPAAASAIDIQRPVEDNLAAIATALDKPMGELTAVVLDKPRHRELIDRIRAAGAKVTLIPEGDVAGALQVLLPEGGADVLVGVGGAPEGVITACAVRLLGGGMQAALAPQSGVERARVLAAGHDLGSPLVLDDLVMTDACCFVATSVTCGALLRHPERSDAGWRTRSLVACPRHPHLVIDAITPVTAEPTERAERGASDA